MTWRHEQNERLWLAYVRYLKIQDRSEQTVKNYFKSVNRLDKEVIFTQATKFDLEEFFLNQLNRVSKATVVNYYVSLKVFFRWLETEEYVEQNFMPKIKVPASDTEDPQILEDSDIRALLKTCDKSFNGRRDESILRLFSEPGSPRLGEMASLTVTAVDWRNSLVQVTGKTGTRLVPYGDKTATALERYLNLRSVHRYSELDGLWLCGQGVLKYGSISAMIERRCKAARIKHVHPHQLRHTAADRAMSAGISDLNMQTLFGWSNGQMLAVYGRSNRTARAIQAAREMAIGNRF